jgi:hypothetical protein
MTATCDTPRDGAQRRATSAEVVDNAAQPLAQRPLNGCATMGRGARNTPPLPTGEDGGELRTAPLAECRHEGRAWAGLVHGSTRHLQCNPKSLGCAPRQRRGQFAYSLDFERFYASYPRKGGKRSAWHVFASLHGTVRAAAVDASRSLAGRQCQPKAADWLRSFSADGAPC